MKILLFNTASEKERQIRKICSGQGIQISKVLQKDYGQKLGYLAGIQGFPRENKIYRGRELLGEMLVFSGMDSEQLDVFLKAYRESGIPPIGCKGILTPHNVFWTAEELFRELWKEHVAMNPVNRR